MWKSGLTHYGGITYAYQDSGEMLSRRDTAMGEARLFFEPHALEARLRELRAG